MKRNALIFTLILLSFSACNRWKKTTSVSFGFEFQKNDENTDFLYLYGGSLSMEKFRLEGERKQSNPIGFTDDFGGNRVMVDVETGASSQPLQYDVQQGSFSELRARIGLEGVSGNGYSIELEGNYINLLGNDIPLILRIDHRIDLFMVMLPPAGEQLINLVEDEPESASIRINFMDWFDTITRSMFEGAQLQNMAGVNTLLISSDFNQEIFQEVEKRIGESESMQLN